MGAGSDSRALRAWPVIFCLAGALAAHAELGPGRAVLPLIVNGVASGDVAVLFEDHDALASVTDLEAAGLHGFAGRRRVVDGEKFVSLASLAPNLTWDLDEAGLKLVLDVAPALLPLQRRDLSRGRPGGILYVHDPSAFLNYSVTVDDEGRTSGFSEAGWSVGRSLLYGSVTRRTDGSLLRGLTNLTVDDRERMVRWVVGDALATDGDLGASAFLAGLSVSRNFELDPYFYRYPGFGISGAVTTPTRADVYVNGRLVRQETLAPGPFDFSNLPLVNGSGETRVVLHDAFGGQSVLASPYYLSTSLLSKGLSEFSFNLGFRREEMDAESFRYGGLAFLGSYRVGLTDRLTAGLRAEAAGTTVSGGATAALSFLPGEIEGGVAASRHGDVQGSAASLRTALNLPGVALGGYGRWVSDRYATVSLRPWQDRPLSDVGIFAGVGLGRYGSLTAQFAAQRWRDAGSMHRLSASYSAHLFDGASLYLSAARARSRLTGDSTEVWLTINVSLAPRTSANLQWLHDESGSALSASLQRSPPLGEGFAYRVEGTLGDSGRDSVVADGQYRSGFGIYQGFYRDTGGRRSGYVTASGGVVAIGGSLFATRPVQRAFALIRIPGVEGVEGLSRNQDIGRTNRNGDLFVPDLLPYYGNLLGIRDTDLPPDYIVDGVKRVVAPPYRGGAVVTFPVRKLRAFTGTLSVWFAGVEVVPAYGAVAVTAAGKEFTSRLGSTGNFYLEDVPPGTHPARVLYLGVPCDFQITLPNSSEPVTRLGALTCRTNVPAPQGGAPGRVMPSEPAPAPPPTPTPAAEAPRPVAPATAEATAARTPSAAWGVQVAAYRHRATAETQAAHLAEVFTTVGHVLKANLGAKGIWYRVVLGAFGSAVEAGQFKKQIAPSLTGGVGEVRRLGAAPAAVRAGQEAS